MAQLGYQFDATQVDPNRGYPLLPEGKYVAHIISSDMKDTKDRSGRYLELQMEILEGPQTGKKVFDRLNLFNQSQQTVDIAQRTLSAICHATGQLSVDDSELLHARRMVIELRVEKGKGNYADQNRVHNYYPVDGAAPVAGFGSQQQQFQPQSQQPQPQSQGRPSAPPWRARPSA
jgi:hypothetical protein